MRSRQGGRHAFPRHRDGQDYAIRIGVSRARRAARASHRTGNVDRTKKLRVKHVSEPHAGMEEFIAQRQVIVAWKERRAYLRDEERLARVREQSIEYGDGVIVEAVRVVLEATGEDVFVRSDGYLGLWSTEFERIAGRAGLGPEVATLDPVAFTDRESRCHLPMSASEHLAGAFAAAEPDTVTMYLQAQEDEMVRADMSSANGGDMRSCASRGLRSHSPDSGRVSSENWRG